MISMKKNKLFNPQELLSSSLNDSNAMNNVDSNYGKEDVKARGFAIIKSTKTGNTFDKNVFDNVVKIVKDNKIVKSQNMKLKRPNFIENSNDKSISFCDLIIPKRLSKASSDITSSTIDLKKSQKSEDDTKSIPIIIKDNACAEKLFVTPKPFHKNLRSLQSPMFTSSPIIQNVVSENAHTVDFRATEIMSSAKKSDYDATNFLLKSSLPSPILRERNTPNVESKSAHGEFTSCTKEIKSQNTLEVIMNEEKIIIEDKMPRNASLNRKSSTLKPKNKVSLKENQSKTKKPCSTTEHTHSRNGKNITKSQEKKNVKNKKTSTNINKVEEVNKDVLSKKISNEPLSAEQIIIHEKEISVEVDLPKRQSLSRKRKSSPINYRETNTSTKSRKVSSRRSSVNNTQNDMKKIERTTNSNILSPQTIGQKTTSRQKPMHSSYPIIPVTKKARSNIMKLSLDLETESQRTDVKKKRNKRLSQLSSYTNKSRSKTDSSRERISAPLVIRQTPFVTRYGRVTRSFAESDMGKHLSKIYYPNG